ncbi:MAG: hypothetical protein MK538_03480, partial [Planctomycetes bacterium]|nr:hypothetical protein [Planctomycetota bacterium]
PLRMQRAGPVEVENSVTANHKDSFQERRAQAGRPADAGARRDTTGEPVEVGSADDCVVTRTVRSTEVSAAVPLKETRQVAGPWRLLVVGVAAVGVVVLLTTLVFYEHVSGPRRAEDIVLLREPSPWEIAARNELREVVYPVIRNEIPSVVGRGRLSGVGTLEFSLALPTTDLYQRELFRRLRFDCRLIDRLGNSDGGGASCSIESLRVEGQRNFKLTGLAEGLYELRGFVPTFRGEGELPLFTDPPLFFRVDLSLPELSVVVLRPGALFRTKDGVLSTFERSIDVSFESGASELESVYVMPVHGEELLPWQPVVSLESLRLPLTVGHNRFRFYAMDRAQNPSKVVEVTYQALDLDLSRFQLHGPVDGRLARVRGEFAFSGDQAIHLRYLVGGIEVEPRGAQVNFANRGAQSVGKGSFVATLELTTATEVTIEVAYSVGGSDSIRLFEDRDLARIERVVVRAPTVTLDPLPARTSDTSILLRGRVEPYFEGLTTLVEARGLRTVILDLEQSDGGKAAEFVERIPLQLNDTHRFELKCRYADHDLLSKPLVVEVAHDSLEPFLTKPLEHAVEGDQLTVTLLPSEELVELHVRAEKGERNSNPWRSVELDPKAAHQTFVTTVPKAGTHLALRLVDLAGNSSTVRELCPVTWENRFAWQRGGSPHVVAESHEQPEATLRSASPRGLILRSEFLREVDLDFRPFGFERVEMGTTEVTRTAWARFLNQRNGTQSAVEEVSRKPAMLGRRDLGVLVEFVQWFEEQANDGYNYFLPAAYQWRAALSGASDPDRVDAQIKAWFIGENARFVGKPARPYGGDELLDVGLRPENRTVSGLYDMEAGVQEIVTYLGSMYTIGGYNALDDAEAMLEHCLKPRLLTPESAAKPTGFRLCRKPASASR